MKFFALFLAVLVAGAFAVELSPTQGQRIRVVVQHCLVESDTHLNTVIEMNSGNWIHVDQKAKCFFACSLRELGFINAGELDVPAVKWQLNPIFGQPKVDAVLDACKGTVTATVAGRCEKEFNIFKCFQENGLSVPLNN